MLIGGTASSGGTSASSATLTNGAKLNRAYGGERTKIAGGAARLDAENWVGALYGSVRPTAHAFVDGVFGFGDLDLKTQRNVSANDSVAFGRRDGSMMFGSLAAGIDRSSKRWTWSSYGRVEYLSSQLNAYVERGAGLYSLSFGKRTARSLVGVLGGRAETAVATSIGMLMPRGRIDWRHEFNDGGTQLLDYADLVELTYAIDSEGWSRDQVQLEIGSGLQLRDGWSMGFDFGAAISSGSALGTGRISASKKF